MKNLPFATLAACLAACSAPVPKAIAPADQPPKVISAHVDLADPFILFHDGTYYAYGTSTDEGFYVYTSPDMERWYRQPRLALNKRDSYGEKWFWAPEVYRDPDSGKFYLYYSAEEHICVAVSDSPLGPFVQTRQEPQMAEKAIDSSIFVDDDGTPYLFFVRFIGGNRIWCAELEDDLQALKTETLKQCIAAQEPWETVMATVAEGPSVLKRNGVYYLIYSANHYESPFYGVGVATADNPFGAWTKSASNPVLQRPVNGLVGTGHGAAFRDGDGGDRYVFHAHNGISSIHPRQMYVLKMTVGDGAISMDQQSISTPVEMDKSTEK